MKRAIKRLVGDRGTQAVQRLGRFRFFLKARRVREEGARWRDHPLAIARFVLFDPETHSYSYDLANRDELARFCSEALGITTEQAAGYIAETDSDPELGARLRRRTMFRVDAKWRMPLGNRMLWYVTARASKPELIVETGIFNGLGSLMLLRALERNAEEGSAGKLVSIDIDPGSGWIVPDRLAARWTRVIGDLFTDLEPAVGERKIGLFIHDSVHDEEFQRFEFELALTHGAGLLHVIDCSGLMTPVLREMASARGASHSYFLERPARHFYRPPGTAHAVFRSGGTRC